MEKDTLYRQLKEQVAEDATLRGQLREQVGSNLGNTTLIDFFLLIPRICFAYLTIWICRAFRTDFIADQCCRSRGAAPRGRNRNRTATTAVRVGRSQRARACHCCKEGRPGIERGIAFCFIILYSAHWI